MLVTSLIRRFLVLMAVASGMLLLPLAQAQNSQGFYTLENVQPSEAAGKIEVLEFFAYTCPHCKTMEPMVQKWSSTLLGDVNFQRVPVAFNANITDLQKLYYTPENLHPWTCIRRSSKRSTTRANASSAKRKSSNR